MFFYNLEPKHKNLFENMRYTQRIWYKPTLLIITKMEDMVTRILSKKKKKKTYEFYDYSFNHSLKFLI